MIFSHIFVSWGSTKRKSVVTSPIVQSWAPGTNLNIMLFCPVIGCLGCSALWLVQMVQQEIFPGAQLCTMGDVTTLFLFDEPQLTIIWLNITMFQNFAHPNLQSGNFMVHKIYVTFIQKLSRSIYSLFFTQISFGAMPLAFCFENQRNTKTKFNPCLSHLM